MQRILFCISLISLLIGCVSKPQPGNFSDPETIIKNSDFRSTITTGAFVRLTAGYTYYEFENQQADTLLVMVHGFSVPSYIWDSTFHAAVSRGYGALRYDAYGRGYSDNPDFVYDAALYSNQLVELLNTLQIDKKVNLLGLSYGGRTISAFAFQYPERVQNLIYVDAVGFETVNDPVSYPVIVSDEEVAAFKQSEAYANMASGQMTDFYDPAPFAGWDKRYEVMMKFQGLVKALLSTRMNSPSMENEHRKIAASGIPVFAFWGEQDTVVKLEEVKDNLLNRLPDVKLIVIPDAGHLPHMEQTSMFNSILFDQIICCNP